MKIRRDFATNSSSSSFIISRDKVTHGRLLDILLEMANEEYKHWSDDDEDEFDWSDVTGNGVGHFRIKEYIDVPYQIYSWTDEEEPKYENVFVIDNEDCGRYYWDAVEKVLDKYGLELIKGYCDQFKNNAK